MTISPTEWVLTVSAPAAGTTYYTLKPGHNLVGRGQSVDIFIDDASASRSHAEIILDPDKNTVTIADLGSTNGTFVANERLAEPRQLSADDVIRIGECTLTLGPQHRHTDVRGPAKTAPLTRNMLVQSVGRHARLLFDVAVKLNTVLDVDTALSEVAGLMSASMGADKCMVILAEQFDRLHDLGFPTSVAQQAIQQKAAVMVPVVAADPKQTGVSALLFRVRSALCVPVLNGDEVMALLYAYKTDPTTRPFDEMDLQVAIAISHQAALTLQRTFLVKQAEAVLRASEQRFRTVVSNSPDLIYTVDAVTGQPALLNRSEYFEYTKSEFETPGGHLLAVHPDDRTAVAAHWQETLRRRSQENSVQSIEYRICKKGGGCDWVQSRDTVFEYDGEGNPKHILVTMTVITEHKDAQERILKSEAMLADAQQLAHLGSWEWDEVSNLFVGSAEFYRMYGIDLASPGMALDELAERVHSADRPRVLQTFRTETQARQPFSFEHRRVLPDQHIRIYQVRGWINSNSASGPARWHGTAHDITEIHQAERALKRRGDELAMLNAIISTINGSLDLSTILSSTLERTAALVSVDGMICHILSEGGKLRIAAHHGFGPEQMGSDWKFNAFTDVELNRHALAHQELTYVPEVSADSRYKPDDIARSASYQTALYIPIVGHDRPLGTLALYTLAPRDYSDELLNLLVAVGSQLGVAIERANLYEIQRRRTDQLTRSSALITALSRVTARLQKTVDPYSVIETLGAELKVIGVRCFVFLLKPQTDTLVVHYTSIDEATLAQIELLTKKKIRGRYIPRKDFPSYERIIQQGQVVFLPDTSLLTQALFRNTPEAAAQSFFEHESMFAGASMIYLPLAVENRVMGVLAVVGRGLKDDDVPAFSAFSGQVAVAIDNARLFDEVRRGRERLRQLASQVISAQEDERRRVSRELHDEAGQALTALKISLDLMRKELPTELNDLRTRLEEATRVADATLLEIRLLAQALRPPSIDALHDINLTIEGYCREFGRRTQLVINYTGADLPPLSEDSNMCLYRFLQECLTNIAKHARAKEVWVMLQEAGNEVLLTVEDDGVGFDPQAGGAMADRATGLGMLGMRERLELLGGWLEIDSEPGQGTRVTAHLSGHLLERDTLEET
jgi:PAS domain S-box-containing protein